MKVACLLCTTEYIKFCLDICRGQKHCHHFGKWCFCENYHQFSIALLEHYGLVKTWCLLYPQCNSTFDCLIWDSEALYCAANYQMANWGVGYRSLVWFSNFSLQSQLTSDITIDQTVCSHKRLYTHFFTYLVVMPKIRKQTLIIDL